MSGLVTLMNDFKTFSLDNITFIGEVVNNQDPEGLDRVQVANPELYDTGGDNSLLPWALPFRSVLLGNTAGVGSFGAPVVGSLVLVILQQGDPHAPAYIGSVTTPGTKKGASGNGKYGFTDPKGSTFIIDVVAGTYEIQLYNGVTVQVSADGNVSISAPGNIQATAGGNAEVVAGGDALVQASGNVNLSGANINGNGGTINWN